MNQKICVVGLGYVGLPLAVEFGKKFKVSGFDINKIRVVQLKQNYDRNNEVSSKDLKKAKITFSSRPEIIKKSNFIIVAVPTPVDKKNNPDLSFLKKACQIVAKNMQKKTIVVFESTVYPGTTQEVCIPLLGKFSGLKYKKGFKVGYSPERINPGDKKHTVDKIVKVVSGCDKEALEIIYKVYQTIVKPGVLRTPSIKIAEAAKVIENIQRDLNIALMNEFKIIFDKLNIDSKEVLRAAKTKWNFLDFYPGLVGGHCIGLDPYYLAYKAKQVRHNPKLILAGRKINENMAKHEFTRIISKMRQAKTNLQGSKILILGTTFKADVKDLRNSKVKDLIYHFQKKGLKVTVCEPMIPEKKKIFGCLNIGLKKINFADFDLVIKAVKHKAFLKYKNKKIYHLF